MPILRKRYTKNFTIVPNDIAQNNTLSYKARGMFLYLWSLPNDWEISLKDIEAHSDHDGQVAVRTGAAELEAAGYLTYERVRIDGKFVDTSWTISDSPSLENPKMEKTLVENPTPPKDYTPKGREEEKIPSLKVSPQIEKPFTDIDHDAIQVLEHLNAVTGSAFRTTGLIPGCLRKGFTIDECILVIDWIHEERRQREPDWVAQYFDHSTPFRPANFDKFLQKAKCWKNSGGQSTPEQMAQRVAAKIIAERNARDGK